MNTNKYGPLWYEKNAKLEFSYVQLLETEFMFSKHFYVFLSD